MSGYDRAVDMRALTDLLEVPVDVVLEPLCSCLLAAAEPL
ncbi:hypothetical protein KR76_00157 [Pimelobacter simplex]|uniref:Uncharacterized protein n=1 Tax=Nocardioides simplex TaxID=2045 RepID=A0A0C5XD76_NOCSI|nr:hypothetical protein KR76_00157 [Pimelobacter simplex]SFM21261.1 hypothetical protein SAMN05421671_0352 [Pimelobacter simplex]